MTGAEFRRIRLRLGLTQTEMARKFKVARNTVTRWETDVHPVGFLEERRARDLLREWKERQGQAE